MTDSTNNSPVTRKPRVKRTREERIAALAAKLEALKNGAALEKSDNPMVVRLQNIRKDILKRFASVKRDVEGYFNEAQGAWVMLPITDRITRMESDLEALRVRAKASAGLYTELPANVEKVDALIADALAGKTVEIPAGILPVGSDTVSTPEAVALGNS